MCFFYFNLFLFILFPAEYENIVVVVVHNVRLLRYILFTRLKNFLKSKNQTFSAVCHP